MVYCVILFILIGVTNANGQVYLTEFLADPQTPLESEWIEIYNLSDLSVDLAGWQVCDLVGCAVIENIISEPDQYIVLCQDITAFNMYYNLDNIQVYELSGWRALNNSGDQIVLKSLDNMVVDSIIYQDVNGGNISSERISLETPGWDEMNWHSSLDLSGSTPGQANSVMAEFSDDLRVVIEDNLFSPGCDCQYENLVINLDFPLDCYLTMTVYSMKGRKIRILYDNQPLTPGRYFYDGKDSGGNYLDIGLYILLVETSGSCSGQIKQHFGVAK